MQSPFNQYALKGNEVLKQLAEELMMPGENARMVNIFKAVLHGIRNRITPEESTQFIAQLPMMFKAIYVDGWTIGKHQKRINSFDKFVEEVYELGGGYKGYTFGDIVEAENGIQAVFTVLKQFVSEGEFNDILATMPEVLRSELLDYLMRKGGLVM